MSTLDRVQQIVCDCLGSRPDAAHPGASFVDDLGADSLDTIELVMGFEEEFDIEIADEDIKTLMTVGDAVKYIDRHLVEA